MRGPGAQPKSDDMVIRIGMLDRTAHQAPRERHADAVAEKAMDRKQKGIAQRISRKLRAKAARGAVSALSRTSGIPIRAASSPIVIAAAVIVVAGMVAARLMSGRSFEGMGNVVRQTFWDDELTAEMQAKKTTRQLFVTQGMAMQAYGAGGSLQTQVQKSFDQVYQVELLGAKGEQRLRADKVSDVNNMLDMLVLRIAEVVKSWFHGSELRAALQPVRDNCAIRAVVWFGGLFP